MLLKKSPYLKVALLALFVMLLPLLALGGAAEARPDHVGRSAQWAV